MENHLKLIYINSKFSGDGIDNRSYFVKTINNLISKGLLKIEIQEKGRVWYSNHFYEGKEKFNLILRWLKADGSRGVISRWYCSDLTPSGILSKIAISIQREVIQEHIKKEFNLIPEARNQTDYKCGKCDGRRIIEAFKHVCGGICFDCGGTGLPFKGEFKTAKVKI